MTRTLRSVLLVALVALVGVGVGTAAGAVLTSRTGTITERQNLLRQDNQWSTSTAAWVNVPGAATSVSFSGNRLIDVEFTAESQCTGSNGTWCSVRAIIVNASTGATSELLPASGTDYSFDAAVPAGTWDWSGHAMERSSYYQAAGTYRVLIQARPVGASSFRIDDWHFGVEVIRP